MTSAGSLQTQLVNKYPYPHSYTPKGGEPFVFAVEQQKRDEADAARFALQDRLAAVGARDRRRRDTTLQLAHAARDAENHRLDIEAERAMRSLLPGAFAAGLKAKATVAKRTAPM